MRTNRGKTPRVFIPIHSPKYSTANASSYGSVEYMIPNYVNAFDIDAIRNETEKVMLDFDPSRDYIALTGPSVVIAFVLAFALYLKHELKVLVFNASTGMYDERIMEAPQK